MGDSLLYDDEMLEELEKDGTKELKSFLETCKTVNTKINELSKKLNKSGVKQLDINADLRSIVETIEKLREVKDKLTLTDDDREKVNATFDKLKDDVVALMNKHIAKYNSKVGYVNVRVNKLINEWKNVFPSEEIQEIISKLSLIEECKVFNNGDWRQLNYLDTLDYDKLEEQNKYISLLERKLKIQTMESVEIWTSCNYIENTLGELKSEIKEDMSLSEINSLLNRSYSCYEELIDLDIRHQLGITETSDKRIVSKYNSKIATFVVELNTVIKVLVEKKKNVVRKPNSYKSISFELENLDEKYNLIVRKIAEYRGECNERVIARLNTSYLESFEKELNIIVEMIESERENLDVIQYKNLMKRVKKISKKHDRIGFDLNISPFMLGDVDIIADFDNKMKDFDTKLDQLAGRIANLGEGKLRYIKDHGVRKEIDGIINDRWKEIEYYEKLLKTYKKVSPEAYKSLKSKLDERKNKFDNVCKKYRQKCPLGVRQVKSAKHLYKKHKKEALIIAGLSVTVLLLGHSVIIPAIMHGNIMVAAKAPAMRSFIKTANNILGGVIGATKDINGAWFLKNGLMINPSVASTSLLKGVAFSGLGQAALLSPAIAGVVMGVKNLIGKMKSGELKKQMQASKEAREHQREQRNEKRNDNRLRKEVKSEIAVLFDEYVIARDKQGMSLEEFATKKGLSNAKKAALSGMEELELEMSASRSSSRKGGNSL